MAGKRIAIWGLAFKPKTDDIREAPALTLINRLLDEGARIQAHDPEAMENVQQIYGEKISFHEKPMDALDRAEALAICTEWDEFRNPDFAEMRRRMAKPVVFDGRNLYEPAQIAEEGFSYYSIGRQPLRQK